MSQMYDTITRLCKNSDGDTIAIQTIPVTLRKVSTANAAGMELVTPESIEGTQSTKGLRRFKRTGKLGLVRTQRFHTGANVTISEVQTLGGFDSFNASGGEVQDVTYAGDANQYVNDVTLGVANHTDVLNIGDTI